MLNTSVLPSKVITGDLVSKKVSKPSILQVQGTNKASSLASQTIKSTQRHED